MGQIDILRLYDSAFLNWFRDSRYGPTIGGNVIPVILATPERAFSEFADLIGMPGSVEVLRSDSSIAPYPFIAVSRTGFDYDMSRHNSGNIRKIKSIGIPIRNWVATKYPAPYNIQYQVDLECRYQSDANIIQKLMVLVNPVFYIVIDFKEPFGSQIMTIHHTGGPVNNSDLDSQDDQSWKRYTLNYTMEAWIFQAFFNLSDIPDGTTNPWETTILKRSVNYITVTISDEFNNLLDTMRVD